MKLINAFGVAAAFSLAIAAHAASIPVANFSFNDPELADGTRTFVGTVPGWPDAGGVRDPVNAQYSGATGDNVSLPGTADGGQTAYIAFPEGLGATVRNNFGITIQANTLYTLTVALGNPLDTDPGTVVLDLFGNLIHVGSTTIPPTSITEGTFTDFSVSAGPFAPNNPVVGGPLAMRLTMSAATSPQQWLDFDNVRLTATVPEPAGSGVLMLCVALSIQRRRRSLYQLPRLS